MSFLNNKRGEANGCLTVILVIFAILALGSSAGWGSLMGDTSRTNNQYNSGNQTTRATSEATTTTTLTTTSTPTTTSVYNSSGDAICEYAYIVHYTNSSSPDDSSLNYDVYYLFDTDSGTAYTFTSNNSSHIDVCAYSGDIRGGGAWGVEVNWRFADGSSYWQYISGSEGSIDISDEIGYCGYGERTDSAAIESRINLPS